MVREEDKGFFCIGKNFYAMGFWGWVENAWLWG